MSETNNLKMKFQKKPLQSSSIASRCRCGVCGRQPTVAAAGSDPVTLTVACCGQAEVRTVQRSELLYTQTFFGSDAEEFEDDDND